MVKRLLKPCSEVAIGGKDYAVNTDFSVWIEIEHIFFDRSKSDEMRLAEILVLAYPVLPPDPIEAVRKILWFYSGGIEKSETSEENNLDTAVPLYDLVRDFDHIWASFLSEFGIDLTTETMHWWKFKTLLCCLDENCRFAKVIGYRSVDVSSIKDKNIKNFYMKMKKKYRLPLDEISGQQKIADSLGVLF